MPLGYISIYCVELVETDSVSEKVYSITSFYLRGHECGDNVV